MKHKCNEIEFSPIYFKLTTKAVMNNKFDFEKGFQEKLYIIGRWINDGSGWIIEPTDLQYINISAFRILSRSSYIKIPVEFLKRN